jgi:hypothetical protein
MTALSAESEITAQRDIFGFIWPTNVCLSAVFVFILAYVFFLPGELVTLCMRTMM